MIEVHFIGNIYGNRKIRFNTLVEHFGAIFSIHNCNEKNGYYDIKLFGSVLKEGQRIEGCKITPAESFVSNSMAFFEKMKYEANSDLLIFKSSNATFFYQKNYKKTELEKKFIIPFVKFFLPNLYL